MSAPIRAVSWQEIERDCRALAAKVAGSGSFAGIVAVARGGLVPAALLAHLLKLPLVDTVCVASYDGREQGEPVILKTVPGDGAGWLVVDDLVDSGTTLAVLKGLMPRAHFATLYAKPAGRDAVDSFVAEVEQDVWLAFPWEL